MDEKYNRKKNVTRPAQNIIKFLDLIEISHMNLQKLIFFSVKSYSIFNYEK
jgi:hypothetical protein